MIGRVLLYTLAGAGAFAVAGSAYVRLAPMDAADWHADPAAAIRTGKANDYLVAEGGDRPPVASDVPPAQAVARLDAVAMADLGVTRLAGSPETGFVTYVARSRVMGFPDAVSVRAVPDGSGSRVSIWSRSRYGESDLGVNRARVERWLAGAGWG